jgi:signal transduction histidine kinase
VFSTGETVSVASADVTAGVFDLRMDELGRFAEAGIPAPPPLLNGDHVAITVVRRANGKQTGPVLLSAGMEQGAWQLRVRHRSGSLEAVVAQSRRRNLAISVGVLGLLAASVVLILAAARRQQHVARQQLEFVAAVSHELRTPLAVICSAGENLADGVIADAPQVKRYGALIEAEGRRLHDMVERVLTFAGIASGAAIRLRRDVDVSAVVAEAVAGAATLAQDRRVTVTVHTSPGVPAVTCDPDALRSAVQNVVDNAIKYSHAGATVDVRIESYAHAPGGETGVRIRVEDRGFGIDAADLGRIFVPFFRGRRAIEAQVRGSGIGLSVVRRVVDAHAGEITIESVVNRGTTVIVTLPPLHLHDKPSRRRAATSEAGV